MSIPLINFKNIEIDILDLYKNIKINNMISFENKRRKNPDLVKD